MSQLTPLMIGSAIFGVLFIISPCFVRKGPNQGIIRCSLLLTVFSLWLFWATMYIAQMNPLIGPRLENTTIVWYLRKIFECCTVPFALRRARSMCISELTNPLTLTCKQARCVAYETGWVEQPGFVKMPLVSSYYETVARRDDQWDNAVRQIKSECLDYNRKFQSIYKDCPEYDILYCAMVIMVKHATASSWSTSAPCQPVQEFINKCPLCPEDCNKMGFVEKPSDSQVCHACWA